MNRNPAPFVCYSGNLTERQVHFKAPDGSAVTRPNSASLICHIGSLTEKPAHLKAPDGPTVIPHLTRHLSFVARAEFLEGGYAVNQAAGLRLSLIVI